MSMHERYARAEGLLRDVALAKVRNAAPVLRWIADGTLVGWKRDLAEEHEWVVADPATGARRLASDGEKAELEASKPAAHPGASPDGRLVLTQRDGNLWIATGGAEAQPVTTDGSPDDGYAIYHGNYKAAHIPRSRVDARDRAAGIVWSPDSRRVIVWRIDQRHVKPYAFLENAPHDGSFRPKLHQPRMPLTGEAPPAIRWFCLDVATRTLVELRLPGDQLHVHQDWEAVRKWLWSPDGSHAWAVMFGAQQKAAYLVDVDLATGTSRVVLSEQDEPRAELNTTLYSQPALAVIGDLEQVIWFSHRSGWGHLYRYDGRSGQLLNPITQGDWLVRDLIDVDAATGRVLFTAQGKEPGNPYLRSLYSVQLDGTGLQRLTPAGVDADINPGLSAISKVTEYAGHLSPDRRYLTYTRSTVSRPPETCVLDLRTGAEHVIETADVSALLASGYVPPEEFTTLAADGVTEIHGVLWRPHGVPEGIAASGRSHDGPHGPSASIAASGRSYDGVKAPLLVAQYASPLMAACPRGYVGAIVGPGSMISAAAAAALGCAVIALDARGTTGRSRAFATTGQGQLHLLGLDDYAAAIRQLGERHSWLDVTRVGITGGSYGGYATVRAMIEFPDLFTCGVSAAPFLTVHNTYPDMHWTAWQGEPEFEQGDPRPRNYAAMDATRQVERIEGHLLMIAADLDENCPLPPIMQFYRAAVEADAPVELVVLPGSNHYTITRTRYVTRKVMDHFCRYLLRQEPPADFRFTVLEQNPEPDDRPTAW